MIHIPVLQKEVLEYLDPKPNENFIDATIGEGGHALAILEKNGPSGKVLGIDRDPEILKNTRYKIQDPRYKTRLILICDNFVNLKKIVERENFRNVSGILFDLGLSSWHLEESGRGFSFLKNEPLDMRYYVIHFLRSWKSHYSQTAQEIINNWPKEAIEGILKEYGEERFARRIAENIIEVRKIKPIKTTFQLVGIIKKAVPVWYCHRKIHFATKVFQALRIAVNDELNNLEKTLPQTLEVLKQSGRLVIISFHSLEDRIVKNFFKDYDSPAALYSQPTLPKDEKKRLKILTKKPIRPSKEEIKINPRSRSAKLRAAIKI